jgi:AMIN domain
MKPMTRSCRPVVFATVLLSAATMAARPEPQTAAPVPAMILRVDVEQIGKHAAVRITESGQITFRALQLRSPERLALDFDEAHFDPAYAKVASALRPVRGVRVGQFQRNVARVVIDLDEAAPYAINSDGHDVVVSFDQTFESPANSNGFPQGISQRQPGLFRPASPDPSVPKTPPAATVSLYGTTSPAISAQPHPIEPTATAAPRGLEGLPNSFANGMLTFSAKDESLAMILEKIGQQGNLAIIVADGLGHERMSVDFRHYRIDEALREILTNYDALYFYGSSKNVTGNATLRTVWVYPADHGQEMNRTSFDAWNAGTKRIARTAADPNSDVEARANAVDSLIRREGHQSVNVVLDAMKDPSEKVRSRALYRALFSGVEVPEDALIDLALNDESADVRFLALQALPLEPTLRWVAERARADSSQSVSREAANMLRELDTPDRAGASAGSAQNP